MFQKQWIPSSMNVSILPNSLELYFIAFTKYAPKSFLSEWISLTIRVAQTRIRGRHESEGQSWNPLKDCALGSLFVMNETLEKSFESSKFDQNRMQKRIGLNMAAFGADSILWATCELYKKNKDKFDDERMVCFIIFDPRVYTWS